MALNKGELIQDIKKSFTDRRCIFAMIQLEELIERKITDDRSEYRITDKDGNELKDVDAVLGLLDEDELEVRTASVGYQGLHLGGCAVTMTNIIVTINRGNHDSEYDAKWGYGSHYLGFNLCYCNDNDTSLPLKVYTIHLDSYPSEERTRKRYEEEMVRERDERNALVKKEITEFNIETGNPYDLGNPYK